MAEHSIEGRSDQLGVFHRVDACRLQGKGHLIASQIHRPLRMQLGYRRTRRQSGWYRASWCVGLLQGDHSDAVQGSDL